jgi:predicted nucleic acid-binding protein
VRVLFHSYQSPAHSRALFAEEALQAISALLALPGIHLLSLPSQAVSGWMALLHRRPVTGAGVFDLQLVATMQAHNVRRIYTFNKSDFDVFPEVTVIVPF